MQCGVLLALTEFNAALSLPSPRGCPFDTSPAPETAQPSLQPVGQIHVFGLTLTLPGRTVSFWTHRCQATPPSSRPPGCRPVGGSRFPLSWTRTRHCSWPTTHRQPYPEHSTSSAPYKALPPAGSAALPPLAGRVFALSGLLCDLHPPPHRRLLPRRRDQQLSPKCWPADHSRLQNAGTVSPSTAGGRWALLASKRPRGPSRAEPLLNHRSATAHRRGRSELHPAPPPERAAVSARRAHALPARPSWLFSGLPVPSCRAPHWRTPLPPWLTSAAHLGSFVLPLG